MCGAHECWGASSAVPSRSRTKEGLLRQCASAPVRQRAWLSRARLPAARPTARRTSHDPSARWPHIAAAADAVRPAPGPGALRPGARSALDMRRVVILRTSC